MLRNDSIIHIHLTSATHFPVAADENSPTRLSLTIENAAALGAGLDTHARAQAMADQASKTAGTKEAYRTGTKIRRVRKENERGISAVSSVVPEGHIPARNILRWLRSIQALPEYQLARKDLKANIWRFVTALAQAPGFDPASMTIMPLWDRLQNRYGFARKSIANYFRRLRDWNVLGVVATGRSAGKTPVSSGRTMNEAAIYVLVEPTPAKDVEKSSAPVPVGISFNPSHATREADSTLNAESAPPLTSSRRAASRHAVNQLMRTRKEHFWKPNTTQKMPMTKRARREAERLAAAECQYRFFPLQNISTAHITAIIRPLLRAGATVNDILHIIDHPPATDARYPHDGATGVGNIGAWLSHRIRPWIRANGTYHRFPSQKAESERIQRDAQRAAFTARRQQAMSKGTTAAVKVGPGWREKYAAAYATGLKISQARAPR